MMQTSASPTSLTHSKTGLQSATHTVKVKSIYRYSYFCLSYIFILHTVIAEVPATRGLRQLVGNAVGAGGQAAGVGGQAAGVAGQVSSTFARSAADFDVFPDKSKQVPIQVLCIDEEGHKRQYYEFICTITNNTQTIQLSVCFSCKAMPRAEAR